MDRLVVALTALLALAAIPGVAVADQRAGGSIVVERGERVDSLTASGGTVIVRGTVDGDLQAYAGTVIVDDTGEVTGSLKVYAGSVRIDGRVGERVRAYGGDVTLSETGRVDGSFAAAAGSITIAGTVTDDATVAGDSIRIASTANITDNLTYDGNLTTEAGAQVGGTTRQIEDLEIGPAPPSLPPGTLVIYGVLSNLVLGAILLKVFPTFSREVVEAATLDTVRSGGAGLAVGVALPIALALLAITIVGIPVALAGVVLALVVAWVATLYGKFAFGVWLLTYTDYESRWYALAVGVALLGIVGRIPYVGALVQVVTLVLGLGAVALVVRDRYVERPRRSVSGL